MKNLFANILCGVVAVIYSILGIVSILQYIIDLSQGRADITYLVAGLITIIFGILVIPSIIYALFKVGGSREFYQNVVVYINKKIFKNRFNYSSDALTDFQHLNTWNKAKSLYPLAYLKPMSLISTGFFLFFTMPTMFSQTIRNINEAPTEYWVTGIVINVGMIIPIYITLFYLNIIFYPWVKMYLINNRLLKKLFISNEGVLSFKEAVSEKANERYNNTPYVHILRFNSNISGFEHELSDKRKVQAYKDKWILHIVLGFLRFVILVLGFSFSFILGWICLPLVLIKLRKTPETMHYIKHLAVRNEY